MNDLNLIRDPARKLGFVALALLMLLPVMTAPVGLAAGLAFALLFGNPFKDITPGLAGLMLKTCVVGLGFGLPIAMVVSTGLTGLWVTGLGVMTILALGVGLGKLLRIEADTLTLISAGTAICGGSAIAAAAPAIKARVEAVSVSLACVFALNAVALIIFPTIGKALGLSQSQFAIWAAIAIHDTSSVVGAAATYGDEALQQATILKLARALWIVPLVVVLAWTPHFRRGHARAAAAWPWFIALFVVAAVLRSLLPGWQNQFDGLAAIARQLLVPTLYLVGSGLGWPVLRAIGLRPLLMALLLWLFVSVVVLGIVLAVV
ncbi:MAG: putative sulfate exporter family transporter [Wenzhouxiangellaceae bacterium]|nr:putative sulfate exporter family transporter [Wenzhouxiangellaceae bacterium]